MEQYASIDVETDGPIPGVNSMLSFGAVVYDHNGKEQATFSRNLEVLPGAVAHPDTERWWKSQPAAWAACRKDAAEPLQAMKEFHAFLSHAKKNGKLVWVGYPVGFDFLFLHWYLHRFCGDSPLSHSALDIKTLAYTVMGAREYAAATKRNMPRDWFPARRHTHVALDDAREQGELFFNIRRIARRLTDEG